MSENQIEKIGMLRENEKKDSDKSFSKVILQRKEGKQIRNIA